MATIVEKLADNLDKKYNDLVGQDGLKTSVSMEYGQNFVKETLIIIGFSAIMVVGTIILVKNIK